MKFDLHVHTFYSDGIYSPQNVIDMAIEKKLQGIAITDHDTLLGLEEAINYSKQKNIYVIPGIEFGSVYEDEDVHILGYFIDYKSNKLINETNTLRRSRESRGIKIIEKLNELGYKLNIEDVMKHVGEGYIGRPHIARAMIEKGYVNDINEALDTLLKRGKPAFIERPHLNITDTINLIKESGGISVLAHPGLLKNKSIINYCISNGLDGLECIHSKHSIEEIELFKEIAIKENLIITGGSDFHGDTLMLGDFYINLDEIPEMKERIYLV